MEVFVHRSPSGFETCDLEGVEELEEMLRGVETFKSLDDDQEVRAEITGTWSEIRDLLSQPFFKGIWFRPEKLNGL
jgi:hypothetical protein